MPLFLMFHEVQPGGIVFGRVEAQCPWPSQLKSANTSAKWRSTPFLHPRCDRFCGANDQTTLDMTHSGIEVDILGAIV